MTEGVLLSGRAACGRCRGMSGGLNGALAATAVLGMLLVLLSCCAVRLCVLNKCQCLSKPALPRPRKTSTLCAAATSGDVLRSEKAAAAAAATWTP